MKTLFLFGCGLAMFGLTALGAEADSVIPAITRAQLEADWLEQARLRFGAVEVGGGRVTLQEDAAGACDNVINGKWGFHTQLETDPWWQVDLGKNVTLGQLRIYNRCDGFEQRAARIKALLSVDGNQFELAYAHDGSVFRGFPDQKPLVVPLDGKKARFIRLQLPGKVYFHLDEVQVFSQGNKTNVALNRPATQSSISPWSVRRRRPAMAIDWPHVVRATVDRGLRLATALESMRVDVGAPTRQLAAIGSRLSESENIGDESEWKTLYFDTRQVVRILAFSNPLLDFDRILFAKRAPGMFPHISDQFYGWWARPGGGLFVLENFKQPHATIRCLTASWPEGNFLRPDISYDGTRVLFAFSQHDARIANVRNKRNKQNVPEEVFYHLFEMDLQTGESRQLTHGKYDDFDGRYLPNEEILFLSTRKGQFLQSSMSNTGRTLEADLPDSYVRCGGDDYRPVPVFTMHTTTRDGSSLWPVSAFETFEYTPSIAGDGRVLYCRWDYIDRFNGHFFSLWSSNPDGTHAQLVYGNYTKRPQATLEPRSIPNSNKILFTAAAHHAITGGSLVLLDPAKGKEGTEPITRLTPEVPFPETERNVGAYFANPWPLSEDFYLVSWSNRRLPPHCRVEDDNNPVNAQGLYLLDRFGNLVLLHRDPRISSMTPIPVRARKRPLVFSSVVDWEGAQVGSVVLQNIYHGLDGIAHGDVKRLRIIGVVPKVQPNMNVPRLGVSREETGKFVLGSVPVETDGSAFFRIPSGLPVFFQALDADGFALQTMRSLTYVQPGQTLSCIGCHEPRQSAPPRTGMLAMRRAASKITPGADGTWPLRFDTLVQPLLDQKCAGCHHPAAEDRKARTFDLSRQHAWQTLIGYADNDLSKLVFEKDASIPGDNPARRSKLLKYLMTDTLHRKVELTGDEFRRLATWMDTYAQTQGSFSEEQEKELLRFRQRMERLFEE